MDLPLLENDLATPGVIEPSMVVDATDMPGCVVLCFFSEVIEAIGARGDARQVAVLEAAHGRHPVYEIEYLGHRVAVMHPGVGAPLAAAFLEEVIALGSRTVVAVGGAGALRPDLVLGHAIVVESAVRDEGTSFHYAAPARTIDADAMGVGILRATLDDAGVGYVVGRTWTTDGFYRETRERTERRVAEGCVSVEMEAAAFIAVARYRGAAFAQLLYAGDSLAGEAWDSRGWTRAHSVREQLFWQAVEACLRLDHARKQGLKTPEPAVGEARSS
jgi:uridine phosphorylase